MGKSLSGIRTQPSPRADALWTALLDRGRAGLTTLEAAAAGVASAPFARKRMAAWAAAGYLAIEPGVPGGTAHRYFALTDSRPRPPMVSAEGRVVEVQSHMTPEEFARTRRLSGLGVLGFGRALGWTGSIQSVSRSIRRFESGDRLIDEPLAEKVRALAAGTGPA